MNTCLRVKSRIRYCETCLNHIRHVRSYCQCSDKSQNRKPHKRNKQTNKFLGPPTSTVHDSANTPWSIDNKWYMLKWAGVKTYVCNNQPVIQEPISFQQVIAVASLFLGNQDNHDTGAQQQEKRVHFDACH